MRDHVRGRHRISVNTNSPNRPPPTPPVSGAADADPAEAMRRELARLREMLEQNSDWIWEVDAQGRYTYASRQCIALLGREPEEVLGCTPFDFMPPAEAERVGRIFGAIAAERRPFSQLLNRNLRKDGSLVVLETSGVPLLDPDGTLLGYRGIDRDITEREAANERLRHIARHDDLTGLPNRMYLREQLAERLAAGQRPGVISLDLDGFKPINDRLGHPAGDRVLTEIGRRLADLAAGHGLFAARPGGDEFVLVLPDGAELSSEAIRAALSAPISLTAGMLTRADRALYEAKEAAKEAARHSTVSGDG